MYKKVVAGFAGIALTILLATPAAADSWRDEQYWLEDYGFTEAWETSMGEGVTVGVIDTGVDGSHQDLEGQIAGGYDASGTGNADGTTPMGPDPNHGTMVASLIAGHGHGDPPEQEEDEDDEDADEDSDDEESEYEEEESEEEVEPEPIDEFGTDGILGTAPKAEILSVSVLLDDSAPEVPSVDEQIADGIHWLVNQGADVINISLASSAQDWPESWDDAFLHAEQNDVVVVVAAGNRASGSEIVGAPATIPGVLTVAGLDQDGNASWDASTQGITIGVAAPANPLIGATPDDSYTHWSGTSGAAPLVSGLAALIRADDPSMPAPQVINQILETAQNSGEAGQDHLYGRGIVDAAAAVAADIPPVSANPMGSIADWITLHRRGELQEVQTDDEGREVAGSIDYPTEIPQAAQLEKQPDVLQPIVVITAGILLLAAVITALILLRKQAKTRQSS
ncbi:type VII secretion-associated serine protease mycosin [Enteractinococcus fodinae]|uniref:Subtilisin family serine protease n=1 Tax=Enteractinococcus fodinae TaxID=684663 RepID=A0ABU2B1Y8_9MICC|nr:S8 family serine peptidase [Enteractinococcus fodinae]MDR7347605.1 subtilisin family serine protease [Enteractinococcus fodinae]